MYLLKSAIDSDIEPKFSTPQLAKQKLPDIVEKLILAAITAKNLKRNNFLVKSLRK